MCCRDSPKFSSSVTAVLHSVLCVLLLIFLLSIPVRILRATLQLKLVALKRRLPVASCGVTFVLSDRVSAA